MKRWLIALCLLLPVMAAAGSLTEAERAALLRHGPWPPAPHIDPSNRASGNPAAIALGQMLFHDARLSGSGTMACAGCHAAEKGWADERPTAIGLLPVDRNSIGLVDVRLWRWFGWDGAMDTLWGQSLRPILDPREMGGSLAGTAALIRDDPALACRYRAAFGHEPSAETEGVAVDAAKAIAAFLETLTSPRAAFDDFRDGLAANAPGAVDAIPADALMGAKLFVGRGQCAVCHLGPNFTNREFHDTGVPFFVASGRVDPGRHGGIQSLRASRFGLSGPFNDDPVAAPAALTAAVLPLHRNWGEFRVPSLRNLNLTAPYLHDGSLATLRDVIRHYSELDEDRLHADGEALLRPLRLSSAEIDALEAFLRLLAVPPTVAQLPSLKTCP